MTLLSDISLSAGERACLVSAPVRAWQLVLGAECCAIAVAAQLRKRELARELTSECLSEITRAEQREMQRVLAARVVLRQLDDVAAELSIPLVVFKGGVAAVEASRTPVDLGDVDVLVDRTHGSAVWDALVARNWTPKTAGLAPDDVAALDRNHFAPLLPPGLGLPVELHYNVRYSTHDAAAEGLPSLSLPGFRMLHRPVGSAGFVALLRHAVIKHPFRRGHLRDLVLIAEELGRIDDNAVADVEKQLASDIYEPELVAMLRQSDAMHGRRRAVDSAETSRFVAWKYASFLQGNWAFTNVLPGWSVISFLPLERPTVRRSEFRELFRYALRRIPPDSPFRKGPFARLSNGPLLPAVWLVRVLYRLALTSLLIASGWHIRRVVSAILDDSRRRKQPAHRKSPD